MTEQEAQIEDAKINFSAIWRISDEVFTKKASEVLNIPSERVEVRRCMMSGPEFGKLTVYVYREGDTDKQYYHILNRSKQYSNLPSNIFKFQQELSKRL